MLHVRAAFLLSLRMSSSNSMPDHADKHVNSASLADTSAYRRAHRPEPKHSVPRSLSPGSAG